MLETRFRRVRARFGEGEVGDARRRIAVVCAVYLVAQLIAVPMGRWWSWDEASYVSQVTRGVHPTMFYPWQFRGVSFLVAPVALLGATSTFVRVWLALLSAAGIACAFSMWVPTLRRAAPVAAFLFAGSWIALFYGSEAMPNLWSAVAGIAATGLAVRLERRSMLGAAACLAAMGAVRLPDALVLGAVLSIGVLLASRRWSLALVLVGGVALAGTVWLVENVVRFGLPETVRLVVDSQTSQRFISVTGPLRRLEAFVGWLGTNIARPRFRPNAWSMFWWGSVGAAAVVGAIRARRTSIVIALAGALALGLAYGVLVGPVIPRFLLPALALVVVPASVGVVVVLDALERHGAEIVRDAVGVIALTLVLSQVFYARQVGQGIVAFRGGDLVVARAATAAMGDVDADGCFVVIAGNAPAIGMALPCRSLFYSPASDAYVGQSAQAVRAARAALARGEDVFFLRSWSVPRPPDLRLEPFAGSLRYRLFRVTG